MIKVLDEWQTFLNIEGFAAVVGDLAFTTDGVGQKLLLAERFNRYDTIGIDLVAMCVNDLLCVGARPFAFLDYYACGEFYLEKSKDILSGIRTGCEIAGCDLVGGETAIMPKIYSPNRFDLAGFAVGRIVEPMDVNSIEPGDLILGYPSSGIHSNGFTWINEPTEEMLTPTRIYVDDILLELPRIKSLAHITGGGIHGNLPRALPNYSYSLDFKYPPFFENLRSKLGWTCHQFESVFNCGWGMMAVSEYHLPGTTILGEVL